MADEPRFGKLTINPAPDAEPLSETAPFQILVLGDFSGRGQRGERATSAELARRKPLAVDRDNVEESLARLDVRLTDLVIGDDHAEPETTRFTEFDDFEPDRLFAVMSRFEKLRSLRRRLLSNETFAAAAEEVRHWSELPQPATPPPTPAPLAEPVDPASALDLVLGASQQQVNSGGEAIRWQALIHSVVTPYMQPGADPRQAEFVACVDEAISQLMRAVLHHPAFRQLEASWRALYQLTRHLPTDGTLGIRLLDLSRDELASDLADDNLADGDLSATALYHLLVEQTVGTAGAARYALVVADYPFSGTLDDCQLLGRLTTLVAASGAALAVAASGEVAGCVDPSATPEVEDWPGIEAAVDIAWQALRQLPAADHLAAVWPGFLLRLPYGRQTRPTHRIQFEEFAGRPCHQHLLWGNGAYALACLLGETFARYGWHGRPGQINQLDDLPLLVTTDDDGESVVYPCAELLLRERGLNRLIERGVLPLVSVAGQPRVQLGSVQSVGGGPLRGRWPD